jgi:hypothetical protein
MGACENSAWAAVSSVTPFFTRNCFRSSSSVPVLSIATAAGAALTIGITSVFPAPFAASADKANPLMHNSVHAIIERI